MSRLDDPGRLAALEKCGLMDSEADDAFDRIARLVSRMLDVPVAMVSLIDDEWQFFKASVGLSGEAAERRHTPVTHSFCKHVVLGETAFVVEDARSDPRVIDTPSTPGLDVTAYAGVPVRDPGHEVLGTVCAIDATPRRWTDDEIATLSDLASLIETELCLQQAVADAQNDRRMIEQVATPLIGLHSVSQQIAASADYSTVLVSALHGAATVTDADRGAIVVVDPVSGDLSQIGHEPGLVAEQWTTLEVSEWSAELTSQSALYRPDRTAEGEGTPSGSSPTGARVVVGIRDRDDHLGAVLVLGWEEPREFRAAVRQFFESLAQVASIATDRARSIEVERNAAQQLQRSLLPTTLPRTSSTEIAVAYKSAAEGLVVSGDFYEAFHITDDLLLVGLGDVMGHDLEAATRMAEMRFSLRALATIHEQPGPTMAALNRLTCRSDPTLATLVLGSFDTTSGDFEYAIAGHLPPLIRRQDGSVISLSHTGSLMIGASPTTQYDVTTVTLEPGSFLVLYSDGLVERRDETIDEGMQRLRTTLATARSQTTEDLVAELIGDDDGRVSDDIAVLALGYRISAS